MPRADAHARAREQTGEHHPIRVRLALGEHARAVHREVVARQSPCELHACRRALAHGRDEGVPVDAQPRREGETERFLEPHARRRVGLGQDAGSRRNRLEQLGRADCGGGHRRAHVVASDECDEDPAPRDAVLVEHGATRRAAQERRTPELARRPHAARRRRRRTRRTREDQGHRDARIAQSLSGESRRPSRRSAAPDEVEMATPNRIILRPPRRRAARGAPRLAWRLDPPPPRCFTYRGADATRPPLRRRERGGLRVARRSSGREPRCARGALGRRRAARTSRRRTSAGRAPAAPSPTPPSDAGCSSWRARRARTRATSGARACASRPRATCSTWATRTT